MNHQPLKVTPWGVVPPPPPWGGGDTDQGGPRHPDAMSVFPPPAGEVAVPYFTGRVTDWVASEDEMVATWPMALLGLSR